VHRQEYAAFERICRARGAGGAVLEIGAVPSQDSLLCMECLASATKKVGISLDGPFRCRDFDIVRGNANSMGCFPDQHFDTVLCSSAFEHDPFFWRTLAEMRRVAKRGALVVIGVPGYAEVRGCWRRTLRRAARMPGLRELTQGYLASTPTLVVHRYPGDYYRFSRQAVEEVLCAGLRDVQIHSHMMPPRFVASGIMP
jgi:hypothetical protein